MEKETIEYKGPLNLAMREATPQWLIIDALRLKLPIGKESWGETITHLWKDLLDIPGVKEVLERYGAKVGLDEKKEG